MQNRRNPSTLLLAAAGVLVVGAFGIGYGVRESRIDEQTLSELARHTSAVDFRTQAMTRQAQAMRDQIAAKRPPSAGPAPAAPAAHPRSPADLDTLLASDPKLDALYFKSYRADLSQHYGTLFHRLKLSTDQVERLLSQMTQAAQDITDIRAAAISQGLPATDPSVSALGRQVTERLGEAEAQIAGTDGASQLQKMESLRPAYPFVDDFARLMAMSSEPISGDQALSLMKLVKDASPESADGSFDPTQMDRDKVLSAAAAFLTSAQMSTLRDDTAVIPVLTQIHEFYAYRAK